jgi:hypothetical protein
MFLLLNTGVLTQLFRIYYSVCNSTGVIAVSKKGKLVQKYFRQGEKVTLEHCILQCQFCLVTWESKLLFQPLVLHGAGKD